jgi:hypothetical protein
MTDPLDAEPNPDAAPVAGEVVSLDAVVPSADQMAADRSNRVGRTSLQVGIPAAIVGIGSWLARLKHVDLDPGAGVDLPADVAGYFVALATFILAYRMNRPPKD